MKNLKEILEEQRDIRDSEIPEIWKESFYKFIFGQACRGEYNDDGVLELIYYHCDFHHWYYINEKSIERDIKINNILK